MRLGLISKRDHKINNYITVHIPTLGEIFDFGQSEYMSSQVFTSVLNCVLLVILTTSTNIIRWRDNQGSIFLK